MDHINQKSWSHTQKGDAAFLMLYYLRKGFTTDSFAQVDRLLALIDTIVTTTYDSKQDGKDAIKTLETVLERANSKAMAAAFKDEKAFEMPFLLTADAFK